MGCLFSLSSWDGEREREAGRGTARPGAPRGTAKFGCGGLPQGVCEPGSGPPGTWVLAVCAPLPFPHTAGTARSPGRWPAGGGGAFRGMHVHPRGGQVRSRSPCLILSHLKTVIGRRSVPGAGSFREDGAGRIGGCLAPGGAAPPSSARDGPAAESGSGRVFRRLPREWTFSVMPCPSPRLAARAAPERLSWRDPSPSSSTSVLMASEARKEQN